PDSCSPLNGLPRQDHDRYHHVRVGEVRRSLWTRGSLDQTLLTRPEFHNPILMHTALGLLNELEEEDVDWIFRVGSERQVLANTMVVREDESLAYIYIVLEGLFGVRVASIPDADIARLGPGEIIGEISFLENTLPSASIMAIESSLLLEIPI